MLPLRNGRRWTLAAAVVLAIILIFNLRSKLPAVQTSGAPGLNLDGSPRQWGDSEAPLPAAPKQPPHTQTAKAPNGEDWEKVTKPAAETTSAHDTAGRGSSTTSSAQPTQDSKDGGIGGAARADVDEVHFTTTSPLSSTVEDGVVSIQTAPPTPEENKKSDEESAPEDNATPNDATTPSISKIIVVGRTSDEDTTWINNELKDWQNAIYYVDLPSDAESPTGFRTPTNKGREATAYLTYIIDHYPTFPDIIAFIHPHQTAWHTDAKYNNAVNMLNALKLPTVLDRGYVNFRCNNEVGCPEEIRPFRDPPDPEKHAEHIFASVYAALFSASEAEMRANIPLVATQCCAQFAVSAAQLRSRPRSDYEAYRAFLLETEYDDAAVGRVMEYMWHIIFGQEAVHCEEVFQCYCQVYGRCGKFDYSLFPWDFFRGAELAEEGKLG